MNRRSEEATCFQAGHFPCSTDIAQWFVPLLVFCVIQLYIVCLCAKYWISIRHTPHVQYGSEAGRAKCSKGNTVHIQWWGKLCPTNSFCVSLFKAASWFFINRGCALPLNHSGRIWHFFSFRPSHLHTFIAICYSVCHLTGTTPNYSCAGFCGQLSSSSASCGINASQEQEHQVFDVLGFFFTYFSVHSIKKCNLLAFEKFRFW